MAYSGVLAWDAPPPTQGSNISFIPYLSGEIDSPQKNISDHQLNAGADVKLNLTSSLNLDITLNPDFSQAEVDQQVTNLDRFEFFFPEEDSFFWKMQTSLATLDMTTFDRFSPGVLGLKIPLLGGFDSVEI